MGGAQPTAAVPRNRWLLVACGVLAIALVVGAYSNSLDNSFHFDDSHVVVSNLYIRNIANLPSFFTNASTGTSLPSNAVYRPIVTAAVAFDYWRGGGLKPRQFHISQVTMLVVLGVSLYFFCSALFDLAGHRWWNRYAALAAAALFSVHVTGTETLNLIHARSELLSAIGVIGSFLVYFWWPSGRGSYLYLVPMIVGALAKSSAVMFAPIFIVYVTLFEQHLSLPDLFDARSRPRVLTAIFKGLPSLIVAVVVFVAIGAMDAPTVSYGGPPPIDYLRTQLFMWLHYGRMFFLPVGLTADTDWDVIPHWYDSRVFAGLLFVAFMIRVIWTCSKTASLRPVAFGLSWFALGLLPASSIVPLAEVTNDHRTFLPYIGLSMAVVWGVAMMVERWSATRPHLRGLYSRAAVVVILAAIFGNAAGAYERNRVWKTEETLWRDVTEKSPANGRAWMNYGLTQMEQGKYQEAKRLFDQAKVYNPNYAVLEVNLGIVMGALGDAVAAESHFTRALDLQAADPRQANNTDPYSFYARWLVGQGRLSEAIPHMERAVAMSPGLLDARHQLLSAYARSGKVNELKTLAAGTLALSPDDPVARQFVDERGEVIPESVATAASENAASLLNASLAKYKAGDFQGCIDAARQALKVKPDYAEAYNNIAAAYASLDRWDDAITAANEALRLKPGLQFARNNLHWAEGEKQKAQSSK